LAVTFGSLFAGIGGFDLGFEEAGMECLWQVEIDPQARRVLKRHWPAVARHEDVRKCGKRNLARPDVVCGGFPCQDLSIAGQGAGLKGERSGLFFEMARIVHELQPAVCVFENVPGLLSNDGGRSAALVLWEFARLRFHGGWRVLDSQYFGVPQRRDRVFGVFARGRAGARRAAEILALTEGGGRDSASGRETKQAVAAALRSRSHSVGVSAPGRGGEDDQNLVTAYRTSGNSGVMEQGQKTAAINTATDPSQQIVLQAHHPRNYPDDALVIASPITASAGHHGHSSPRGDGADNLVVPIDMRQASRGGKMTNNRRNGSSGGAPGTGIGEPGDPAPTLADTHTPAVAFTLKSAHRGIDNAWQYSYPHDENGVRRLMPVECLRLQAFPDDWLDLDPPLSDSAKYRLIGNAVTKNVAAWLGRRVVLVLGKE
jgi:DNA (cytosine-5)-methyltransferase 1